MAITHSTSARNSLADQIDSLVNTGATDAQGDLVIFDSGDSELVRFNLQDPAFGAASSGQITLQGTTLSATAGATGTADYFEVQDKDNSMVFTGSVTATGGGGDAEIDNTSISSGQTVNLTSGSYSAPS